ncbi:hypothetical protein [Paenibacillus sp. NAIST15-1]|uniref:hypothetical protein n=1 Tax=Paenibacillus sp. NAIST15-1 TaxID=1605994 RepID=UPI000869EA02|nr:hypothetical protein [Paenibacillus sp. NAIST15-1]GAV11506.1 glycogen synthase [Paenibacillus sp. NAIST15-1]
MAVSINDYTLGKVSFLTQEDDDFVPDTVCNDKITGWIDEMINIVMLKENDAINTK